METVSYSKLTLNDRIKLIEDVSFISYISKLNRIYERNQLPQIYVENLGCFENFYDNRAIFAKESQEYLNQVMFEFVRDRGLSQKTL